MGSVNISWKVEGLAALEKKLESLKDKAIKRSLRAAVRAGGVVFRNLIKAKAPREAGKTHFGEPHLADDISISTRANEGAGTATANVRPKHPFNKHKAMWAEYGVKAHEITVKQAKALGIPGGPRASVHHPGIAPHPFMRPSADEGKERAVVALKDKLVDAIEKEIAK